jgi:hypothetical protein
LKIKPLGPEKLNWKKNEYGGWLDIRGIDDRLESIPGLAKLEAGALKEPITQSWDTITGSVLVDAANLFLNQLAITAINNLMRNIGRNVDTYTSPYDWTNPDAVGPNRGGITAAKARFRKIIEPIFNVRGDYNILNELSVCPDPTKAGPTNCVMDSQFQSAVEAKLTVAEAMKQGYLKADAVFGFMSDGLEPNYIEGYPYRSMKILRKFRIIPVGWELAAQFIAEKPGFVDGIKTLEDLVSCYDPNDAWDRYDADWCRGLVDPNWVLKAPLNYCQREGPGPEIVSDQVVGSGEDSYRAIKRNENYCADEQTCIMENKDGSCAYYGYCTEERPKWDFNGDSCDPLYNTCQTYRSTDGQTVSYLNNTLDYGDCDTGSAGCLLYCEDYSPSNITVNTNTVVIGQTHTIEVRQNGALIESFASSTMFNSNQNAIAFYNLVGNSTANPLIQNSAINQSNIFIHHNNGTGQYSLGFVHDRIGGASTYDEPMVTVNGTDYVASDVAFPGTSANVFYSYTLIDAGYGGFAENLFNENHLAIDRVTLMLTGPSGGPPYSFGFVAGRTWEGHINRWNLASFDDWYSNNTIINHGANIIPGGAALNSSAMNFISAQTDWLHIDHDLIYEVAEGAISVWFNTTSASGHIFSKDSSGNGGGIAIYIEGGELRARIESATTNYNINSTRIVDDGAWHLVTFNFGGALGPRLYLDDFGQVGNIPSYNGGIAANGDRIILGASAENYAGAGVPVDGDLISFFNGVLDELNIYNRRLSSTEILAAFNNPSAATAKPAVATLNFTSVPVGTTIAVVDDADDNAYTVGSNFGGGNWLFDKLIYNTDGGMLNLPNPSTWPYAPATMDIAISDPSASFVEDITGVSFARDNGAPLYLVGAITLSLWNDQIPNGNVGSNGSFNITGGTSLAVNDGLAGWPNVSWNHDETETDGGMVTLPNTDNWSITIDPTFFGIDANGWFFKNNSGDTSIPVLNQAVTINLVTTDITANVITTTGNNSNWGCTFDSVGDKLALDKDAEACSSANEGCHEFIRTKPGVNLLKNSGFEEGLDNLVLQPRGLPAPSGSSVIDIANDPVYEGQNSLHIYHDNTDTHSSAFARIEGIIPGETYSVSYHVNTDVDSDAHLGAWVVVWPSDEFGVVLVDPATNDTWMEASVLTENYSGNSRWRRHSFSFVAPANTANIDIEARVQSQDGNAYFDAIKVEKSPEVTVYTPYGDTGRTYLKLAPEYLGCDGNNDPAECSRFVRECSEAEMGCNLYTALSDGMTVPARLTIDDYCPAECSGYDEYIQRLTSFDSDTAKRFIPESAQACNAQAVGCDEFTNLDRIGEGAEAREYYSELKQCIVETASTPNPSCNDFYTWEGSSETGYQLRVFRLSTQGGVPALTNNGQYDGLDCDDLADYDLETNPMCREFYDRTGARFYDFLPYVITCSDDCHPYRRTLKNILPSQANAFNSCMSDCDGNNICENQCTTIDCENDSNSRTCVFNDGTAVYCKDGGMWRNDHQSCLYNAIPDEGVKCSANASGCREFTGSSGYNIRQLMTDNFESGNTDDWNAVGATVITPDASSLLVGGHSLRVQTSPWTINKDIGSLAQAGKTYVLRFLARSPLDRQISARIVSAAGTDATAFNGLAGTRTIWQIFELNTDIIDWDTSAGVFLEITGTGDFYVDDIQLTEVSDRYYLITESWDTPDSCYSDINGNYRGPEFNLGCEAFSDPEDEIVYVNGFSQLCRDDAVGCELMIDTYNYTKSSEEYWLAGEIVDVPCDPLTNPDCRYINEDEYKYVVYNSDKLCNKSDKGCQLLGKPYDYEDERLYTSTYLKNDPDKYSQTLCATDYANCQSFSTNEYSVNFKDPGDQVCEYRATVDANGYASNWDWYKKEVKRCDVSGNGSIEIGETSVCLTDNDCFPYSCVLDNNDYPCATDEQKTIGYGGYGNQISQPTDDLGHNWVGLCPAEQSGCSEYIDASSDFNPNIIFNPTFADLDGDPLTLDGWDAANSQELDVQPFTLYRFSGRLTGDSHLICDQPIFMLESVNVGAVWAGLDLALNFGADLSGRLVYMDNNTGCTVSVADASPALNKEIELREVAIDYQLQQNVDRTTCNGLVENSSGCVLFNERVFDDSGYKPLRYDADLAVGLKAPASPEDNGPENDSNTIIKVSPNRVCDKWLACKSFVREGQDTICHGIGLCDSLNRNGDCDSFVSETKQNQSFVSGSINGALFQNKTGQTISGFVESPFDTDYYPVSTMEQVGNFARLSNGGFELYNFNNMPLGWSYDGDDVNSDVFRVVGNPFEAEVEGIGNAPEGRSYLKLGSSFSASSDYINVERGNTYVLSAYINTINLFTGSARIKVEEYNSNSWLNESDVVNVELAAGENWTFALGEFSPNSGGVNKIKLVLYADGQSGDTVGGNFYFDDIKLRYALSLKSIEGNNEKFAPQTCRLYPEDDALSCEYFEESGILNKGLYGYCLEHDSYPGSTEACLNWYPVDRVEGDGIEEGFGYGGKMPVYYCAEAVGLIPVERKERFWASGDCGCRGGGVYEAPLVEVCDQSGNCSETGSAINGWVWINSGNSAGCGHDCPEGSCGHTNCQNARYDLGPAGTPIFTDENDHDWYLFDGSLLEFNGTSLSTESFSEIQHGLKFYNPETGELFDDKFAYCTQVVQAVTETGVNKYWSGRVYEGSDYQTRFWNKTYDSIDSPFGSIIHNAGAFDPYYWDGSSEPGIQPLYVKKYIEDINNISNTAYVGAPNPYRITGLPTGASVGVCADSGNICLTMTGVTNDNNKVDCAPGEGVCVPMPIANQPADAANDVLRYLFAESYGTWAWNNSTSHYEELEGAGWSPPEILCNGTGLPSTRNISNPTMNDYCAVIPQVNNIVINSGDPGNITLPGQNDFVNLTFNSVVDSQQLPLVMYSIDWRDGDVSTISGVEMRSRPNEDTPHSLFHLYSYWELRINHNQGVDSIFCGDANERAQNSSGIEIPEYELAPPSSNYCAIQPRVKIKDNWGWCSCVSANPAANCAIEQCNQPQNWTNYGGYIVVLEN